MQYVIKPTSRNFASVTWWDNVFTNDELDYLQQLSKTAVDKGEIGGKDAKSPGKLKQDLRRTYIEWLHYSKKDHWVFEKISSVIKSVNEQYFGFDINGLTEPIQLTNYKSEERGTYGWHSDRGPPEIRKLSFIMQLSDPEEYEGGELQLNTGAIMNVPKKRGYIIIIPSFVLHQVTPVTKGSRQSLVSWISGPEFK